MAHLEQALVARLGAVSGVTSLVSTRVFPMRAEQNSTRPYLTYSRVDTPERASAMGTDAGVAAALMQVDIWASTQLSMLNVAEAVPLALQRWRGTQSISGGGSVDVLDTFLQRDADEPDDDPKGDGSSDGLFRRSMDFLIWYREAAVPV